MRVLSAARRYGREAARVIVCCLLAVSFLQPPAARAAGTAETACVVLLHGLWRSGLSMKALEWELEDTGYTVANISYPSLRYPIARLAEMAVAEGIDECRDAGASPINFVTHSLGGILVRHYLRDHTVEELGRVVMLGPPNQGSQVADYADSLQFLDVLTPIAVEELTTGDASVPRQLGPAEFELGVIAGTGNRRPPLPGIADDASDGTVSVRETQVEGMTDFITMPAGHTFMMWKSDVIGQVLYFLERGQFETVDGAPES